MVSKKAVVSFDHLKDFSAENIGSKAKNLSLIKEKGFKVPKGFVISKEAHKDFVSENRLDSYIDWEMTRKTFDDLRWEEIWDSALRIRLSFLKGIISRNLEDDIKRELSRFDKGTLFSVRSSSPDEDSREYSFAGIHESFVNVSKDQVFEKIKLVWASLWSDRSLLYRKEHSLDSLKSSMAVIVQVMEPISVSGLLFSSNPSNIDKSELIIEAIEGQLNLLVDNRKSPDRVILEKDTGSLVEYVSIGDKKILGKDNIEFLYKQGLELEKIFKHPVDIEWTGTKDNFTVLQVRPITSIKEDKNKDRQWYLSLTPQGKTLIELTDRVDKELIPKLQEEGEEFSKVKVESLSKQDFLDQLKLRGERYKYWLDIYWSDFIPLAHGIRNFGVLYNDLLTPEDPYEFINLLKTESLIAYERNDKMKDLARDLIYLKNLREELREILAQGSYGVKLIDYLNTLESDKEIDFKNKFLNLLKDEMDVLYDNSKLDQSPEVILSVIVSLSDKLDQSVDKINDEKQFDYLDKYIETSKEQDLYDQAKIWLHVGKVSWKLRDDDNILLGKIENQLLSFIEYGIALLKSEGKSIDIPEKIILTDWIYVYDALVSGNDLLIERDNIKSENIKNQNMKSRQLIGQPSSKGVYTGNARIIKTLDDFKDVKNGEVLVFDTVQPQMTFIISLAGAIIERRGGMLVHSSIIAREMNIPAVNGVTDATSNIETGDTVTVNGDLGIVVIATDNFDF